MLLGIIWVHRGPRGVILNIAFIRVVYWGRLKMHVQVALTLKICIKTLVRLVSTAKVPVSIIVRGM